VNLLNKKFRDACEFHLPTRTLANEVLIDAQTQESIDKLATLIQKLESDKVTENVSTERVSVPIPTYGEIKDAVTSVTKTEVIVPGVEKPIIIETPVIETPATTVSDVINERGEGGFLSKFRKKGNKPKTGFLNKDITKKKLGLFGGNRNVDSGGIGGGTPQSTVEVSRTGLTPPSIAERLRNKRNNQK
jgi:hypothetical protein